MHARRARPTLRVISQDLTSDWESPLPRRSLVGGRLDELHPLSELPHPLIAKAVDCFGPDAEADHFAGGIVSSTRIRLLEIKAGQWRGGIWQDSTSGVNWLVVAGLAKGQHRDRDDFYERVQRENDQGDPGNWLPTADDVSLLKKESAARLLTAWELALQRRVLEVLRSVSEGGSASFEVLHPVMERGVVAVVSLEVVRTLETGYVADETVLEIVPARSFAGSNLLWNLKTRLLISIHPPEQDWDAFRNTYSNIFAVGSLNERVRRLQTLVDDGELPASEPGSHSHYTHRNHLAGSTIEGTGVRGVCGVFFVPAQDHVGLPLCPVCQERFAALPK